MTQVPQEHRLVHSGRLRLGPVTLGIVAMSPDPADRAARIDVVDRAAGFADVVEVREGEEVATGRHTVRFIEVFPGDRDGYVVVTVEETGQTADADTPGVRP
ncbi:hypothetical protein [Streptomyces alanosinicus]|uniref:Uncharacterized protein n=1 Tax=Streptomyces alanosinicus TaxID=68171 RepID=A0A918YQX6_9ACTN|nr:hypothetical protein [Streptomyces alanosinicus]GHE11734.1 hypothetical protein GCM10010339_72540 [Streptomyces alanosinicus]